MGTDIPDNHRGYDEVEYGLALRIACLSGIDNEHLIREYGGRRRHHLVVLDGNGPEDPLDQVASLEGLS